MAMKIVEHKNIKVRDLVEGYMNDVYTGQLYNGYDGLFRLLSYIGCHR